MLRAIKPCTAISLEMAEREEGKEFGLEEKLEWCTVVLAKGDVVEVYIPRTNLTIQVDTWCAFVVLSTSTQQDASQVAEVKFLGCTDGEVAKMLEEEMNGRGRRGLLHFCPSQPCSEVIGEPFTIHVLRFRLWSLDGFKAPFMDSKLRTRVRQWLRREKDPDEEEDNKGLPEEPGKEVLKRPAGALPSRSKKPPKASPKAVTKKGAKPEGTKMTASMRAKLRERLALVRKETATKKDGIEDLEEISDGPEPTTPESEDEASECALDEIPTTGTKLMTFPPPLAVAVAEGKDKKHKSLEPAVKKKKHKKKKKEKKERALEDRRAEALEDIRRVEAAPVGTRDFSTKNLRSQLVKRAVMAEKLTNKDRKHRKGRKDAAKRLKEALTDVLSPKDAKKRKKGKKKRRMIRPDGVIESLSSSSESYSEEDEEESLSSAEDLETPMKQKSRDRPGSVLKMLTQHVQEQLEQAATTEMGSGHDSLTGGVKILTYFALQIKPNYTTQMREMREMFHLANVMDTLRRGEIAKVGDALAARFMAIHQSLLDQNWSTARFMEIFPLEESSAASSSMVLATRKHTKLVAKVQGFSTGGWSGPYRGRGKGGKGGWYEKGDPKGEGKDGKGKGKKGKDKTKGKNETWRSPHNEWKEKKDKPEEK